MRRKSRLIALLVLPLLAIGVAACTSDGGGASQGAAAESHLDKILESKVIRVAVPSEAFPWGIQKDGELQGYDIDLATALGESLGAKVEFVTGSVDSRIPNLQTDKADVLFFSFTASNDRAQVIEVTVPYASVGTLVAVPEGSDINSYEDLAGRSVAAVRGGTAEKVLASQFPDAKVQLFETQADEIQALKSGKVDALMEINTIINGVVQDNSNFRIVDGDPLAPAMITGAVKRGDQLWLNYLNTFIRNWNISGQNATAAEKWFGTTDTVPAQ